MVDRMYTIMAAKMGVPGLKARHRAGPKPRAACQPRQHAGLLPSKRPFQKCHTHQSKFARKNAYLSVLGTLMLQNPSGILAAVMSLRMAMLTLLCASIVDKSFVLLRQACKGSQCRALTHSQHRIRPAKRHKPRAPRHASGHPLGSGIQGAKAAPA